MDELYKWTPVLVPVLALVGSMVPPIRRAVVGAWRKLRNKPWPVHALRVVPLPSSFYWSPGGSRDDQGQEVDPIAWLRGEFQVTAITDHMTSVPAATVRFWPLGKRLDCHPPTVEVRNESGLSFSKQSTDWPIVAGDPDPQKSSVELSIEAVLAPRPSGETVRALVTLIDNFGNKQRFRVRFRKRQ